MFQKNSRFATLAKDLQNDKKEIRESRELRPQKEKHNFFIEDKDKGRKDKDKDKDKDKVIKKEYLLSAIHFPELCNTTTSNIIKTEKQNIDFLNIINQNQNQNEYEILDETISEKEIFKPGWCYLKIDKNTNKILVKKEIEQTKNTFTKEKIILNVFESLSKLYEKRKNNYIDMWGYDEYEDIFKCKNYNDLMNDDYNDYDNDYDYNDYENEV